MILKRFLLNIVLMSFIHSVGLFAQNVQKTLGQPLELESDAADQVIINGIALSTQQIMEVEQTYGVKPLPRNYWYDMYSGLYGAVGYLSCCFMLAGHDLGELRSNASNGDSPVFVNQC